MNANLRNFALWVIIVLLLLALFTLFQNPGQRASSRSIRGGAASRRGRAMPVQPRIRSDRPIRDHDPGIREGQLRGGGTMLGNRAVRHPPR